jgi:acetyl-CoA synthetase (ADP-forming)
MDCQEIINQYISSGDTVIPEPEAQKICHQFGISCPATRLVTAAAACLGAAQEIGYPVVIKVASRQIIHKSDVGGVITGIQNSAQLADAYDRLLKNVRERSPQAEIQGVLVQKQAPKGVEVVVGGLCNQQFGPVVMVGLGGIYVEVFKDVAFRLAPLDKAEAGRQLQETRAFKLLQGVRGEKPCDVDALCELIVNTGRLISVLDGIAEIDFNPVFCYPQGCTVVDARMVLKPSIGADRKTKCAAVGLQP